ncbi:Peptidyl-prolyl cis-trans isomerase CWC27 like protein [Eufriesea mexicana]|uniref:Peptidyl-prolyl cis-trans isomerase CWC27 like protein n=1 Tax=Eufriesea mexicana TaxID=516756 RepID=A0A310SCH3_9HYME|nr:Peptidyl-prolyl cis-trans isomerase CWC27 like protein [Eufriesea mexicana]
MRIIEEMENEQLIIVMKGKVKLDIECKCCIKAKMSSNIYRYLDTIKGAITMVLWHIVDFIGSIKPMSKGGQSSTTDLQNKHTTFGRVTGEAIYSMLKLEEALVDENDKPLYPPRLIKPIILKIPFFDIIPRIIGTGKDFNLLSFHEEAEKDEIEYVTLSKKFSGEGKATHDHLTDPKLS